MYPADVYRISGETSPCITVARCYAIGMQTEQMIRMVNETSTNIRVMAQMIEDAQEGHHNNLVLDLEDLRKDMQHIRNGMNRLISEYE